MRGVLFDIKEFAVHDGGGGRVKSEGRRPLGRRPFEGDPVPRSTTGAGRGGDALKNQFRRKALGISSVFVQHMLGISMPVQSLPAEVTLVMSYSA